MTRRLRDYPHEDYFTPKHASGMTRSLFLSGTQEGASAKGRISACTHVQKLIDDCHLSLEYQASFQDAELSNDTITIKYKPDYVKHGQDNTGHWTNCNVIPNGADEVKVTLTRRKPCNSAAACSYHVTRDEIRRAVEEECRKRHIELPSFWEAASGIGTSVPANEIGFVLPLEQYPILVVGGVSVDPCKSTGEGAIQVELFVVEMKKVNGKWQKGKIIKRIDGAGSGDFSPKGLNQAIGGALDAANLDQYRVGSSS